LLVIVAAPHGDDVGSDILFTPFLLGRGDNPVFKVEAIAARFGLALF